jgi:transposase
MPAAKRLILTDNEHITLRELAQANGVPCRTRMRAMALRLNAIGWSTKQIAAHLGWHEHTLRNTLKRWQNFGLVGLWERSRTGRNRTWTEEDWLVIEQCLNEPRRYSALQLSQQLQQVKQIHLGAEQIRRILKKKDILGKE